MIEPPNEVLERPGERALGFSAGSVREETDVGLGRRAAYFREVLGVPRCTGFRPFDSLTGIRTEMTSERDGGRSQDAVVDFPRSESGGVPQGSAADVRGGAEEGSEAESAGTGPTWRGATTGGSGKGFLLE